ncbi:MAG: twin-arginine translocase subunit TatC [Leptospirales bacterium]|nr:twin-arginine translocase subunit TatC [Leptospirales bacterium]
MATRKKSATRSSTRPTTPPPPPPPPEPPEMVDPREKVMSLGDHLEELRKRILISLAIVAVCSIGAGFFVTEIHRYISAPYTAITGLNMTLGSAMDALNTMIILSIAIGLTIGLPLVFFVLFEFITPALERKTAFLSRLSVGFSCILFWSGVAFCWFFIFPISVQMMFKFLLPPNTQALISLDKYYSFFFILHIGTGVTFQIPLIIVVLGGLGVVKFQMHVKSWRFVILGLLFIAMAVTPGDPVSMFIVAGPLLVFYLLAVAIVYLIEKTRSRREAEEEAEAARAAASW